jgi:hypothetical protein
VARIDGAERAASFRNGRVFVSTNGLRRGRHTLALQVSDYQETRNMENVGPILPNTGTLRVRFTVR